MHPRLIQVPRADHGNDPDFILLHVASAGGKTLDLDLIGTENDNVFTFSLKHSQTSKLKEKKVNQEEWLPILSAFLLGTDPEGASVDALEGIEAIATILPGPKDLPKSITIVIQRNIEGITQKLGTITLPRDPDGDGDLYEWCSENILANEKLTQQLQASKVKLDDKDAQIKKLETSLAELVKLKNDNDAQLLEKFSLLLNEKKLKIRDQQRLLQSSNIDPSQLKEVEEARSRSRSAVPSRINKRKAGQIEDEEANDTVDKMDVDDEPVAAKSDRDDARNTDDSTADEETADEPSEDEEPPAPAPKRTTKQEQSSSQASSSRTLQDLAEPPQKRELPFAKKPPAKPAAPKPDAGSETESDDEL
ncbi:hypothetical protein BKA65DRAFT_489292 [Rhexocercosporidium sp. MPI-PUGE-AT-0058]|nr:hypothetical protein BKA65DRAFT_489292 [Rhexocercosporidium sp. MPI-PUGE-AT-0058]